jgi:predicted MFS family arabinose efflux permease
VVFFVYKYVPKNEIKVSDNENKSKAALKGLLHVLKMPTVWMASITALSVYWCYINLIYTVPYLQAVFNISQAQASIFGIINTGAMGVVTGLISGTISDYVFKSSSKMMFVSLALTAIALVLTLIMPKSENMLMANIILLMLFSFSIFLSKGIILAPITEANVPKDYSGSSMSVGSFAAYAPVFWVYGLNGKIIDTYDPIVAYQKIFTIGVVVALAGMVCAFILLMMNNKNKKIKIGETDI